MKIKKGFMKNNWPMMAVLLIIVYLAVTSRSIPMIGLGIVSIVALVLKYRRYDEQEQEANDWWKVLSKEDKKKVKESGVQ